MGIQFVFIQVVLYAIRLTSKDGVTIDIREVTCRIDRLRRVLIEVCAGNARFIAVVDIHTLGIQVENQVVILTLSGDNVLLLANQMAAQGGQGVSGMTFVIDKASGTAWDVRVQGKPVKADKDYYVVTSDYLSGGADGMDALADFKDREYTGNKIRSQYISYVKMLTDIGQPVAAKCDGRVRVRE